MKHLEVRQKYSAACGILNSLLGVSSGDEDCVSCLIYFIKLMPQSVKKTLICMWFRSPFRRKARFIHTFLSFLPRQDQQAKVGGLTPIRSIFAWHFTTAECTEKKMKEDLIFRPSFRWCCTGRQATTIFRATQRCHRATIRDNIATILQHCVALKIVVAHPLECNLYSQIGK